MWRAVRGPGWIRIPQGESWRSASPWVQHQFRGRAAGARLSVAGAGAGSVQPQVRVGGRALVGDVADGVLHGRQVAARGDAHGLDHLLPAARGEGEGQAELQQSTGTDQEHSRNVGFVEMA